MKSNFSPFLDRSSKNNQNLKKILHINIVPYYYYQILIIGGFYANIGTILLPKKLIIEKKKIFGKSIYFFLHCESKNHAFNNTFL